MQLHSLGACELVERLGLLYEAGGCSARDGMRDCEASFVGLGEIQYAELNHWREASLSRTQISTAHSFVG